MAYGDRAQPLGITRIERAGIERIDELEPLWRALREHHAVVGATVAPVRAADDSWLRRRADYVRWLSDGSGTLLIAEDGAALGYAMLRVFDGPPTWAIGDQIAEVETLSVLPSARGRGIGHALIAVARDVAVSKNAATLSVAFVHTNSNAKRFYEREGFRPFYLSMLVPLDVSSLNERR
jgi:GNAT superfamily N-acetyltransferase